MAVETMKRTFDAKFAADLVAASRELRGDAGDNKNPPVVKAEQKTGRVELTLTGFVGYDMLADAQEVLATLRREPLAVALQSPGGEVFAGLGIYNLLASYDADVSIRVLGEAHSAASVILQAGDTRTLSAGAGVLIHNARALVIGTADTLRRFAGMLDATSTTLADIYAARSGRDVAEFSDAMAKETLYVGQQAVSAGLADEVLAYKPAKADKDDTSKQAAQQLHPLTAAVNPFVVLENDDSSNSVHRETQTLQAKALREKFRAM